MAAARRRSSRLLRAERGADDFVYDERPGRAHETNDRKQARPGMERRAMRRERFDRSERGRNHAWGNILYSGGTSVDTATTTTTTRRSKTTTGKKRHVSWRKIMQNVAPFVCLALQYGAQPLLTKKFINRNTSSLGVVAATEMMKIVVCLISMFVSDGMDVILKHFREVKLSVFALSVFPATVYSIQNMLMQYGYHSVDAVSFNCLNQTKIIWTALFVYVVFGTKQTFVQCISLLGLVLASVILPLLKIKEVMIEPPAVDAMKIAEEGYARYLGILAVTMASCLSGLASTSTQISLQALKRPAQVLTIEMAIASIPIVYFVHVSKIAFGDANAMTEPTVGEKLVSESIIQRFLYSGYTEWSSIFDNFTALTFIPIFTSAIGGICVGLVTKNLGSVAKGFAISLGLILTGVIESFVNGEMLRTEQVVGLLLVGLCTHLHTTHVHPNNSVVRTSKPKSKSP